MPISVLCPKCLKKLSAPDSAAGKRAKCPHCGQVMQIPDNPTSPEPPPNPVAPPGFATTPPKVKATPPKVKPTPPGVKTTSPTTPASARGLHEKLPDLPEELPDLGDPNDIYGIRSPFDGVNARQFDEMLADAGPKIDRPASEPERYPCPACGEMIVRGAAKCRYCGEVFDPVLKQKQKKKAKKRSGGGGYGEDLTAMDWVLAIVCSGIGCIVGIVYLIQGDPRGGKMIGISLLASFAKQAIVYVLQSM